MLNFNNVKKRYMNVTMRDDKVFLVCMPKKKIFERFLDLQKELKDKEPEGSLIDDMYDLTAEILANNKLGREVTTAYVADTFDVEDIQILFTEYMNFVSQASNDPN